MNSLEAIFVLLFTTIVMSATRAALSLIESAIKKHNVVVFSKTTCPFSVLAKRILSEAGVEEMKVYEIEQRQDAAEIQVRIWKVSHVRDKMKMVMKIYNSNGLPIEIFLSWSWQAGFNTLGYLRWLYKMHQSIPILPPAGSIHVTSYYCTEY